jgi:hypothetical protein
MKKINDDSFVAWQKEFDKVCKKRRETIGMSLKQLLE